MAGVPGSEVYSLKWSFAAIHRVFEGEAAINPAYRERLRAVGKRTLAEARQMSDAQLVGKLQSLGVAVDRATLSSWSREAPSAEALARRLRGEPHVRAEGLESDWIWLCLTVLWERWFPDRPSFEMIDDKMDAGYQIQESGDDAKACEVWLETWRDILAIMDRHHIETLTLFDDQFAGSQCMLNWVQDFGMALWNAGQDDRRFLRERVAVYGEAIHRWPDGDPFLLQTLRSDMAETTFALGNTTEADTWFRELLADDPRWGWGWIHWADCYHWADEPQRDLARAESILKDGLAVPDVTDRLDLLDRLADLYDDMGRDEDAAVIREVAAAYVPPRAQVDVTHDGHRASVRTRLDFGEPGLPVEHLTEVFDPLRGTPEPSPTRPAAVGRNDPCPCGSGRKYKKCCLRKRPADA